MSSNDTQFFKQSLTSEYWVNFNVDTKFTLAGVAEPEIDSDDRNQIRAWVLSQATPKTAPAQAQPSSLYRPILDPFEIRVLEILPGTGADKLRGRLRHCSLELKASFALAVDGSATPMVYTALSYTWGPNVFDEMIECEGHVKNITKSLAVALRAFRQEDRSVVMWIDQICINQDDNEEKAQQIPLMSRIYQNAMNTIIWLGESTSNSASAIKFLEDVRLLLQFTEKTIGPDEFEGLNLPSEDSEVWQAIWDLLSRPWFTRLWIIQEVILSFDAWVVCGNHMTTWDVLSLACLHLWTCGISRWLTEKNPKSGDHTAGVQRDLCESVQRLSSMKSSYHSVTMPLFDLLVESREANCYDNRDKVYGLLGVCDDRDRSAIKPSYAEEFPVTHLYRDITTRHLENNKGSLRLGVVLTCVDHESLDLPSWVPDWRNPRQTHSLGHSTTTATPYMACGHLTIEVGKIHPSLENTNKDELRLHGISVDTVVKVSTIFTNPDLNLDDPTTANKDLKDMCSFVAELQDYPGNETVFSAFWQTLVAGKDATEMAKAPSAYEEIISLLLDASTGLSPSLPGQTYSPRQRRPAGKGKLELASLKTRTAGKTFQDVKTSMVHAMRNRRLGFTTKGHLGLLPHTSRVGDEIQVFDGCHIPYLLRKADGGSHRLVGESYVHGIMRGEAVKHIQSMDEVVLK
ncbi:heterokaryon incompatibility protein-domain-containing protein [Colletotrichum phormii]|uniref:Heterokaryon incompatibility protein-domain-containing protein n=1 Tax=Colletotrichum phormii TaxID=359342 RepID=A0AAI9ZTC5_9PEZI|nr:heterokaryon incompatibility protein-domain-containing protein [Colletotrichum phormii]KAK1637842.1 heterokaryon incompatibility protein-domain-containing protein [Colletotrichum phormii]